MPKVLRIINRLNLGGPTYNAAYLSRFLEPEYETLLVAGMKDDSEASSAYIVESLGLKPRYIKAMYRAIHPWKDYQAFKELVAIIKEFKPDIVHTHAAKSGTVGRLAAFYCGVPIVLHTFHGHVFHSYFHPLKTKIFLAIERFLASKSTKIIAISSLQKKELSEDFKVAQANKFEIVPLGFDLNRFQNNKADNRQKFREKYGLEENDIAIGMIGRLVPVKNHKLFLEAFAKMKARVQENVKAILIGDGELRQELEAMAKALGLRISSTSCKEADVLFTSWITAIETALPGLEIVALSSFNEGTPVSLIEAQASNIAIVSTRVGGIEDIVLENKTALLAENDNVDDFSDKLKLLVENRMLREEMQKLGYSYVESIFSYQTLCANMKTLYDRLYIEHRNKSKI